VLVRREVVAGDELRQLSPDRGLADRGLRHRQGDAVLVRSLGQVALIDTGRDPKLLRH
jgi:metal-dependent hydrolase (beta-lactamase superfamily II)